MTTHFQTSAQQFNNRTVENTVPVALGPCDLRFVADVSAVTGNASSTFALEFLDGQGALLLGLLSEVRAIGRADLGASLPPATATLHLRMDVSGRMTIAFRVVSFALDENVPEVF